MAAYLLLGVGYIWITIILLHNPKDLLSPLGYLRCRNNLVL